MHLTQIGLGGIDGNPGAMLHIRPGMRIADQANSGNQLRCIDDLFGKPVR